MILNEYETTYVIRPDLTDDLMGKITAKYKALITDNAGQLLVDEDWGKRKLAYPIKKHARGHYVYLNYVGPSQIVAEVERILKNEEDLLRFLTVVMAKDVDVDERKVLAADRQRQRQERMAAQRAEEEAERRYREEVEEADEDGEPAAED